MPQRERTRAMKEKDFDRDKARVEVEETKVMPDPAGPGDEESAPKVRVRSKGRAVKDIIDYLDANGDALPGDMGRFEVSDAVAKAVDALYGAYETDGVAPTREGFAERCEEPSVGRAVLAMPEDPFVRKPVSKGRVAAVCAGCGLAIVLLVCGVAYAVGASAPAQGTPAATEAPVAEQEEDYVLRVGVSAEGWDASTSTPVIAHIVSEAQGVDYCHAYAANEDVALAVPAAGEYEISFVSPINADGSVYRVPDASTVSAEVGSEGASDELPFEFELVATGDVSPDELTALIEQVAEAIGKGDGTLTGEAGAEVAMRVEENAKANPNADEEAVEEGAQEAVESSQSGESAAQTGGTTGSAGSGSGGSGTGGSAAPSGGSGGSGSNDSGAGTSGGNGSSSSGGSSSGGASGSQSKPSHTHNWVAQTKTVHHDAVYKTVHHDAEYRTVHHDAVTENRTICNNCGTDITGNVDAHMKANIFNGCGSYSVKPVIVQAAYDEQVLVKDAWDEQVLVSAAWDETVTTGYRCSTCGATK